MNITVLGATGSTGSRITRQLLDQGHQVRAAVRNPGKAATLRTAGAQIVPLDLTEPPKRLRQALAGSEVVINAAATTSMSDEQAQSIDRHGGIAAIDAAAATEVRAGSKSRCGAPVIPTACPDTSVPPDKPNVPPTTI